MARYLLSRLLQAAFVLLVMTFVMFNLIGLMPGDPVENMMEGNPTMSPEAIATMREMYGTGTSIFVRYWNWMQAALTGDFGYSSLYFKPVFVVLVPAILQTLKLMVATLVVAIPLATVLGAISARKPNGKLDNVISFFSFAAISVPGFWLALVLMIVFSVQLGWLPTSGRSLSAEPSFWEEVRHLIMPVTVLTCYFIGPPLRYMRASMIETMNSDYIRTARAKGLSENEVLFGHGLRNALIPMVTVIALSFGSLFSGALVIEAIFGILGMGKLIFDGIRHLDFNLALVALLLATVVTLLANLVADLAYAVLDPRISLK